MKRRNFQTQLGRTSTRVTQSSVSQRIQSRPNEPHFPTDVVVLLQMFSRDLAQTQLIGRNLKNRDVFISSLITPADRTQNISDSCNKFRKFVILKSPVFEMHQGEKYNRPNEPHFHTDVVLLLQMFCIDLVQTQLIGRNLKNREVFISEITPADKTQNISDSCNKFRKFLKLKSPIFEMQSEKYNLNFMRQ